MAVVVFGVVGILTMLLIYFVLRTQTLQNELTQVRNSAKTTARKTRAAFTDLALLMNEIQREYGQRLDAANRDGLIAPSHYEVANVLVRHFSHVVMDCCEKDHSVEHVLEKVLQHEQISLSEVNNFLREQPKDVRLAWAKNTPHGFVTACSKIAGYALTEEAPPAKQVHG